MIGFTVKPIGDIITPAWAQEMNRLFGQMRDDAANYIGSEIVKDFQKTTETWEHQPDFRYEIRQRAGDQVVTVGPEDNPDAYVYMWVDEGTQPHRIIAKQGDFLKYQGDFKPKTTPRKIGSQQGGKSGKWVWRTGVLHPGIAEPRHFSETIAEVWQEKIAAEYGKRFEAVINRAFSGGKA